MNIEFLREFTVLAECKSFTRAAARAYVSQPALSKHMLSIETDLGVQLICRDCGPIRLTPIGKVFLDDARQIVRDYDAAVTRLDSLRHAKPETLSILTYSPYRPMDDLMRLTRSTLREERPLLDIGVSRVGETSPIDEVRSQRFDLCFTGFPITRDLDGLIAIPLYDDPLVAVVRKGHRLANERSISVEQIGRDTILFPSARGYADPYERMKEILLAHGVKTTFKPHKGNDMDELMEFDFTSGIFISDAGAVLYDVLISSLEEYVILPFKEDDMRITAYAVYLKDTTNEACEVFVSTLKSELAEIDLNRYWKPILG